MRRPALPHGPRTPLDALFAPRSIAVVGASDDPAKWGNLLSRRALESCGGRPVALVNRRGAEVLGRPTVRTLAEAHQQLGGAPDLVVLCTPAAELLPSVGAAVEAGARSLVVITAGLSEVDADGARLEREAAALATAHGTALVGPNCLGVVDTGAQLQLAFDLLPAGSVAVLSQSGNLVLDLAALMADRGLGVSRFVSLGNQAALTVVDLLWACVEHEQTKAVAVYVEDVRDGRGFLDAALALAQAGKPLVVLAPGRSSAAVRSAVSHTGSLTTASAVVDAACAAVGAHRVDNPTQLADLLQALLVPRRLAGRRIAVVTDGGGHGAVAADALEAVGLQTPTLREPLQAVLRVELGTSPRVANPVDLAGAGEQDQDTYARAVRALLAADEVDGVVMTGYFGGYSVRDDALGQREVTAARSISACVADQHKPVVVQTMHPLSATASALREAGIPVHRDIDRAVAVLAGVLQRRTSSTGCELPLPASPVTDASYDGARRLLSGAGISFPAAAMVHSPQELDRAVEELGFPLVLKALGRVHKSDAGGVVVGLRDERGTRAAYDDLRTRLDPPAVSVESMVDTTDGVEVIVGCVRDPRFGPVVMVGLGGVLAEVLADTALAIGPVSALEARDLWQSLKGAAVLQGARGRRPVDLDALSDVTARLSQVAAAHPELVEVEVNPVLALPSGAVALDARVVLDPPASHPRC